ncbi:MAG TPA: hypothetical protein DDY98_02935 [Ruminococcaceae bacterium]|nr:hypothetical protein [Oscillospiraceae bacterium]
MINTVIEAVVFAVTLCGALVLTYTLALLFVSPCAEQEFVIVFRRGDTDCARQLYAAQMRFSFFSFPKPCRVLAVDCGISEEERRTCRALCRQCGGIALVTPEELTEIIKKGEASNDSKRS